MEIAELLLAWYEKNARILPWREDPSPYRVWISEIMLQQTRVEAVIPYFERFVSALPTVEALAEAPEELLLKLWEGLGYYSRVRNLKKAAMEIVARGGFPDRPAELEKLPGIGPYTAGAIASIAFAVPVPAVDGNVRRVLARFLGRDLSAEECAAFLRPLYGGGNASSLTQGWMELGATVCLPNGAPRCPACPLQERCVALREGRIDKLPAPKEKKPRRVADLAVFRLECGGKIALRKRAARGLLAGLWELPNCEGALDRGEALNWGVSIGGTVSEVEELPPTHHIFTHLEWRMRNYRIVLEAELPQFRWVTREELRRVYALPSAFGGGILEQKNG